MPRLYLSPATFANYPASLTFPVQVAQLNALSGAMDRVLANASRRVDRYARKRIGAPSSTTIAAGGISAGGTVLNVNSTLGFDGGDEQAVMLNPGGNTQETILLTPGPVVVSSWASPYPGSLALATPTTYAHNANEGVQGVYQEVSTVGSSSSSDAASAAFIALNQAAQLARAHAPAWNPSILVRTILLKCYPVTSLLQVEHMLPFDTTYGTIFPGTTIGINPAAGYMRLPLGSFVLPEGLIRTTYTAGYTNIPDEVQEATAWYAADELQAMVSQGAYEMQQGKVKGKYQDAKTNKSLYVQRAEDLLDHFRRRT